jgi:hypothetical protein
MKAERINAFLTGNSEPFGKIWANQQKFRLKSEIYG